MGWARRAGRLLKRHLLGVKDTPHRIAFGVFLGVVVGCTPTMGLQIAIYLALATLIGANKISGIPVVLVTNPLTAVPLYYYSWKVGSLVLHGSWPTKKTANATASQPFGWNQLIERIFDTEFWSLMWRKVLSMGTEIWVGSLIIGFITGGVAYAVSYHVVVAYRARRRRRGGISDPPASQS